MIIIQPPLQKIKVCTYRKDLILNSLFCVFLVEPPPQQYNETRTAPIVPKLDLPSRTSSSCSTVRKFHLENIALSIMAEKKRQKWMREKGIIFQKRDFF